MGVMRFFVQPETLLRDWPEVHRAYLSGHDQTVWPTRIELQGNQLLCRRQCNDSGKLHVAWPVAGFGRPVVITASLPERASPYILAVELARGKLVQVRNQIAAWQAVGMTVPTGFLPLHREAHRLFARAAGMQETPLQASELAQQSLELEFQAAEVLMKSYTKQRLESRQRQYPALPTALGCGLGHALPTSQGQALFPGAFNAASIPLEWRFIEPTEGNYRWDAYDAQVDWCQANGLVIRGGPLLDLAPQGMPDWLSNWENDYWNLLSFVCDFVETCITRYMGRIRNWEITARGNTGGALNFTEEQRLTLTAKVLEVARNVDEEGQFVVRIDQPWGEYQARGQHRLSPIQFADALVRAGLGVSAINLEIAVGYAPRGSAPRDLLDFSRMIDHWSALGIPLQVTLAFPSGQEADPRVNTDLEVPAGLPPGTYTEQSQAEWVNQHLPLLLAKPSVVAIYWTHFTDATLHRFPHAGLISGEGKPKPALERIESFRKQYWK